MMIAAPRVNAGAWFGLAAAVPTALLAIAAALTSTGPARDAGLAAALLLAPAVVLALRSLESRDFVDLPAAQNEADLIHAFCLTTGQACGLLLTVLLGARFSGEAIAVGLAMAGVPLALAVGADVLRRLFPPLEATGLAQALKQPDARRRQWSIQWSENERLKEMARQRQTVADIAGQQARLGAEEEARQRQEPVGVRLAREAADRAARARADEDKLVRDARRRALAEIEAEAEILQQASLEAHEERGPDVRVGEGLAERLEREIGPRVRLAFGQGAGEDGRSGGEARQGERVVKERRRPLALRLQSRRAQLLRDASAVAYHAAGAGLQVGPEAPGRAAGDVGGVAAMAGGEQVHDGAGLPVGAGGEHEGVVYKFHPIKLWASPEEIQPSERDDWTPRRAAAGG